MNKITGKYVSDYDAEKRDNTGRMHCPFCGEVFAERDMEEYQEEGTERSLDICSNCREGYEQDLEQKFDSDVLPSEVFSRIWDEAPAQGEVPTGLNETTAPQVAQALGGEAWQSGGGIWLVLVRRKDGRLVVISDDVVGEYASEADFEAGKADKTVLLS